MEGTLGTPQAGKHQPTILVVDDESSVRLILARLLEHIGYTVLEAEDGPSALALVQSPPTPIDCMLVDVSMPEMSGVETARAVHVAAPKLAVILMSGHTPRWLATRDLDIPVAGFLQKPFSFEDLQRTLDAAATDRRAA